MAALGLLLKKKKSTLSVTYIGFFLKGSVCVIKSLQGIIV